MTCPLLPPRPADGHKGTFGRVLVVGGSVGMSGAVCLSSLAALRSGSGLVTAAVPCSIQSIVAAHQPCVMTQGLAVADNGALQEPDVSIMADLLQGRDAVAIGPGLGQSSGAVTTVRLVLQLADCPVVLDADALNIVASHGMLTSVPPRADRILTPHPGEFCRLTGCTIEDTVQSGERLASQFARKHRLIVVLKGPHTIVTDGIRLFRNHTGNSGMATAGSGDVLTGIVASLLGQGMMPLEAAALAVHAHGIAGDEAARQWTQRGMIASDLLNSLPDAWRRLEGSGMQSL